MRIYKRIIYIKKGRRQNEKGFYNRTFEISSLTQNNEDIDMSNIEEDKTENVSINTVEASMFYHYYKAQRQKHMYFIL